MAKYNKIAVIYGSDSSEWEVACRSGEYTASRIDDTTYDIYEVFARFGKWELVAFRKKDAMRVTFPEGARPQINKNDFSVNIYGEHIKFDYAYIMQHGSPGENGLLQGYFEMLAVPFSSCSSFVSNVVFDKYSCKCYLKESGLVKMAKDTFVRQGANINNFSTQVLNKLKLPVFVKPTDGGSSFGISKVKKAEDLQEAINYAFSEGQTLIIEEEIKGRELTCAAYFNGKDIVTLPIIEIVTTNEYFDYDAKYNGNSKEICPAPICKEWEQEIANTTCEIYKYLGCKGVVRIDYIYAEDGLYFLEVNTIPGMTSASLVPKMVRTQGIDITQFLTTIIENS